MLLYGIVWHDMTWYGVLLYHIGHRVWCGIWDAAQDRERPREGAAPSLQEPKPWNSPHVHPCIWHCMVWQYKALYSLYGMVWYGFVWHGARNLPMEQSPSASQQEPLSHLSPYFLHTHPGWWVGYPMFYTPDFAPLLTIPIHTSPYQTCIMSYTPDLVHFLTKPNYTTSCRTISDHTKYTIRQHQTIPI